MVGTLVMQAKVYEALYEISYKAEEKPDFVARARFTRSVLYTGLVLEPILKRMPYPESWLPAIIAGPILGVGFWRLQVEIAKWAERRKRK